MQNIEEMKRLTVKASFMHVIVTLLIVINNMTASAQYYMNVVNKDGSIIQHKISEIDQVLFTEQIESGPSVTYDYVDMGLSVKWASYNVGAEKPTDYGYYYSWGETKTKNNYIWYNYKYRSEGDSEYNVLFSKYNSFDDQRGNNDNKVFLDSEDDIAHVMWGGAWRIPSKVELLELFRNSKMSKVTQDGVDGFLFTSTVTGYLGCSIFLPAAGYKDGNTNVEVGTSGVFQSNSTRFSSSLGQVALVITQYDKGVSGKSRYVGTSVRPVCSFDESEASGYVLNRDTLNMYPGEYFHYLIASGIKLESNKQVSVDVKKWSSSNSSVATVVNGVVKAIGPGTCKISASLGTNTINCNVTVKDPSTVKPEYVDLGLSVKWATFDIGAFSPEMCGYRYAWGEIEKKDNIYKDYNTSYKFKNEDGAFTKYCCNSWCGVDGATDNKKELDLEDDVAHVEWGGDWRIPTKEELKELIDNCTCTITTLNGVEVCKMTSNIEGFTDKYIYFNIHEEESLLDNDSYKGYYWTKTLNQDASDTAYAIGVVIDRGIIGNYIHRSIQLCVRPVCP